MVAPGSKLRPLTLRYAFGFIASNLYSVALFSDSLFGFYTRKEQFQKAETAYPRQAAEKMEVCFREMGDYKMAYYYATKLRQTD